MQEIKEIINKNLLTNCFILRDKLFMYLENGIMQAYVRNDVLFIFQKEEFGFYKFYYFVNELQELFLAQDLLEEYFTKGDLILEFTTKNNNGLDELRSVLESLGFCHYACFERFLESLHTRVSKKYLPVLYATQEDLSEIYRICYFAFDPLINAFPTMSELERLIKDKSVFIEKDAYGKIIFIYIVEFQGKSLHSGLLWLAREYRKGANFLKFRSRVFMMLNAAHKEFQRCYSWIDVTRKSYALSKFLGRKSDGLTCNIFAYKKERILEEIEK